MALRTDHVTSSNSRDPFVLSLRRDSASNRAIAQSAALPTTPLRHRTSQSLFSSASYAPRFSSPPKARTPNRSRNASTLFSTSVRSPRAMEIAAAAPTTPRGAPQAFAQPTTIVDRGGYEPSAKITMLEALLHEDLDELEALLKCDFGRDSGAALSSAGTRAHVYHEPPPGREPVICVDRAIDVQVDLPLVEVDLRAPQPQQAANIGVRPSKASPSVGPSRHTGQEESDNGLRFSPPRVTTNSGKQAAMTLSTLSLQLGLMRTELDRLQSDVDAAAALKTLSPEEASVAQRRIDSERVALDQRAMLLKQAASLLEEMQV